MTKLTEAAAFPIAANAWHDARTAFPASADFINTTWSQVATNCRISDQLAGSNKALIVRSAHSARVAITQLSVVIPNWYQDRNSTKFDLNTNGPISIRASVEYPEGTLTNLTFDGQVRPFCPDFGAVVSDLLPITIPAGARFGVRVWYQCSSGTTFFANYPQNAFAASSNAWQEKFGVSTTTVTDYTQTATWNQTAGASGWWPFAIIAPVAHAGVSLIGDSITGGINDVPDASGDIGMTARIVGPSNGYINLGSSGDSLSSFRIAYKKRLSSLPYTRNAICNYGTNDIGSGRTLTQIQGDMIWLWSILKTGRFAQKKVLQTTITPQTNSTDSWATTANQTAKTNFSTAGNGTREQLNDWLRDGAPILNGVAVVTGTNAIGTLRIGSAGHPLDSVWDVADQVESARNSGKWKVDATANKWTADGVHPSQYGYQTAAAALVGNVSQLVA